MHPEHLGTMVLMSTRSTQSFFDLVFGLNVFWNTENVFSVLKYFSEVKCFFADGMLFIAKLYGWIIFIVQNFATLEEPYAEHLRLYENKISPINTNLDLDQFWESLEYCLFTVTVYLRFLGIFLDLAKSQILPCIKESLEIKLIKIFESKYSRMDQVKFVEDSL